MANNRDLAGDGVARSSAHGVDDVLSATQDFSLVMGGPLFQLFRKAHLSDDAMQLLRQRLIVICLLAWLPLVVLSAFEGTLWGDSVAVPLLMDFEVHIRFLVAMPLLILAEMVVHKRIRPIARAFLDRNLIPEADYDRFHDAIKAASRLRNSVWAEVALIALVYGVGVLIVWRNYLTLDVATWYATPSASGNELSISGMWLGFISLPMFQFLLVRWHFRIFVWARFLWQVSRISLRLIPTHPDRVGGLGFLSNTVYAFTVLAVAHGAIVAANLAGRILYMGEALPQFKAEIVLVTLFMLCLVFGPFLVFAGQLSDAKRVGLREYGSLAERYVREFDRKWLRGGAPADEPLVGSADIQSLADLGNSFQVVQTMNIVPVTRDAVVLLAIATLLPIVPLGLTMMPLEDLVEKLFGLVF